VEHNTFELLVDEETSHFTEILLIAMVQ